MAGSNKKLFTIMTETSVSDDDANIDVPLGSSTGKGNSSQENHPDRVEPESQVAVGVEVPPNDRAPLVNAADRAEGSSPEDTTTANDTGCCDRYTDWAEKVADSWVMLTVLLPLLGGSVLFIYMGASYYHLCPFYPHFPLMTIIMGASGGLAILIRILRILRPCRGQPGHWFLRYLTNNGFFVFLVIFVLELGMYAFSGGYPTQDTGADTYCDKNFYEFLKTKFGVVIVTVLLSGVIYGPLMHRFFQPLYNNEPAQNYVD